MPKIAVYAGHGGADNGAQGNGFKEKDLTLAVMLEVTDILRKRGYEVINNRTTDVDRSITEDAAKANREKVDAVVEIHLNSNEGEPQNGTETYYSIFDGGAGRRLANNINNQLVALGFADRGIKNRVGASGKDYFGIIRLTKAPAVLVETAFINSPSDMAKFDVKEVALAVANGISETFPIYSSGNATIRKIQRFLNSTYGFSITVDGIFGPETKRAIVAGWQTELNRQFGRDLEVDGIFGPKTKAATVSVRRGARGNMTYLLQSILYARGYSVEPDGIFGPDTEMKIKAFQNDVGLPVTGIADAQTQSILFA